MESSVLELFDSYGVPCAVKEETHAERLDGVELGSIIGFRGKGVRGGLAFVAPLHLLEKLLPVPRDAARSDVQLRDWSAEIANQLIGRFKNKLSARAFDFDVGTAVCFKGSTMSITFPPQTSEASICLTISWAGVSVYLDCAFAEGAAAPDGPSVRIVPEGDVLLF